MLFYVKKSLALELCVLMLLAALGAGGINALGVSVNLAFSPIVLAWGVAGAFASAAWNGSVQLGYLIFKGRGYTDALVESLAKYFVHAPWYVILIGGATAGAEEVFFRGFLQGQFGILLATFAFGVAHRGGRDIRVVSLWAFPQGLLLGLIYALSGNMWVSMLAHGFFDIGGFTYFRWFMRGRSELKIAP